MICFPHYFFTRALPFCNVTIRTDLLLLCASFKALAEALKANTSITAVDVSGNNIGDDGAKT